MEVIFPCSQSREGKKVFVNYLCLVVESHLHHQLPSFFWDRFQQSFGSLDWCGTEDFAVEEDQVDEWIGSDAFCPTDCSPELLSHVENQVHGQEQRKKKYYYSLVENLSIQEEMTSFQAYLHHGFQEELKQHSFSFQLEQVENKDWTEDWKNYYQPQKILDQWEIHPSWYKKNEDEFNVNNKVIYIHPAMAFGTGTHETTQLCLELYLLHYDRYFARSADGDVKKRLCLDYGCGSGILGLMALNYPSDWDHVYFYDIDPLSLQNTQHNIELRPTIYKPSTYTVTSDLVGVPQCDFIWANLIEPVLNHERSQFLHLLEDGGMMIISGLLREQETSFFESFIQNDFRIIDKRVKNDWMALLVQKTSTSKSS
jgi:ribosomal protein L11 methyltransferase